MTSSLPINRRQAVGGLLAAAPVLAGLASAPAEAAPAAGGGDFSPPQLSIDSIDIPLSASVARVPVRMSKPTPHTLYAQVMTRNGLGDQGVWSGGQYDPVSPYLCFRPGDGLVQEVAVPTRNGRDGQHFDLIFPEQLDPYDTPKSEKPGAITFRTAAPAQAPLEVRRRPAAQPPSRGAPVFELELDRFEATDSGYVDAARSRPCWRTRLEHGRDQPGNGETAIYTDPVLHPGTRPFEIRDGLLILRPQKLAAPLSDPATQGRSYANGAAVLTSATLFQQTFGYFEWEARAPGWWWPGLWLYGGLGAGEIDVMERWPGYDDFTSNAALHHPASTFSSRLRTAKILANGFNLVDQFHRHAVDWRQDRITWFIDEVEVFQSLNPCTQPLYVLMDVTLPGGAADWAHHSDPRSCELAIRSFRVWK